MPRPPTAAISRARFAQLFSEQGGCCAGCFKPLGEDIAVDHVEPLARGGTDRYENMQLLHSRCNATKSDMPPATWFRRAWFQLQAEQRVRARIEVIVTLDAQMAERLRFAAELARKTIATLIEESLAATVTVARSSPLPRRRLQVSDWPRSAEPPAPFMATWSDVAGAENADLFEGRG